jgi:hypothetical protein
LSARRRAAVSLTSARNNVAGQQQHEVASERGAGDSTGNLGSSPWLREVNLLNLSVANSDDEQAKETETFGSGKSDDQVREGRMTPMEIRTVKSASRKSGSGSVSTRLPTSDDDEDEGEVQLP